MSFYQRGNHTIRSLDTQRQEFIQRRFLAMPVAGMICWMIVGIGSYFLASPVAKCWLLFIATGSIVYVAMLVSKLTGETFFRKEKNTFDRLFFQGLLMALLVYSIAIPFFLQDYRSLPMSVGILTGLMWMPFSWIVQHWIGTFHTIARTLLITLAWFLWPGQSFVIIPAVVIVIYIISIHVLETRWRKLQAVTNTAQELNHE